MSGHRLSWIYFWLAVVSCGNGSPAQSDLAGDASGPSDLAVLEDAREDRVSIEDIDGDSNLPVDAGHIDPQREGADDAGQVDVSSPASGFWAVDLQSVGNVRAMWASPEAGFWAVGDNGLVLKFNGVSFVPAPLPPTTKDLFGISGEGGTVVVVGAAGTVLRWFESRWSLVDPPGDVDLYGVGVIGPDEFYVSGKKGALYRYTNGAWFAEATGVTSDLLGVHASKVGGVFAVGAFGTLLEQRGGHWVQSQIALPTSTLRAIWRSPDGKMFVVGTGGAVSMYDGLTWKIQITNDPSDPPRDLYAVTGFSGNDVIAVGNDGVILAFNGKKWNLMTIAGPYNSNADLRGVAGVLNPDGTRTVFAVGLDSRALRLDGKVWHDQVLGVTTDLNAVTIMQDGRVLAVGDRGLLLVLDDNRLGTIEAGTTNDLMGAVGNLAVGADGTILSVEDDRATFIESPVTDDWNDVWGVAGVALLAGERGTLVRLDDEGSSVIPDLTGVSLKAVCVAGGGVFTAGTSGRMFVDEGAGFRPVATGTLSTLWDLRPATGRAVLAVGDHGIILSCDPISCRRIHEDPSTFLYGLGRVANGLALAVGWAGMVKWIGDGEQVFTLNPGTFRVFRAAAGVGQTGESYLVGPGGTFYIYRP